MLTFITLAALFALLTAKKGGYKTSQIPPAERKLFDLERGQLFYKQPVADMILASLLGRIATPSEVPHVVIVSVGNKPIMGADEWGAYWALQGLHAQGADLWVPVNMHVPTIEPRPVLYLSPGASPPDVGYARLIAASQPWPMLPAMPGPPLA